MEWMIALTVGLSLVLAFGVFYMIVKWVLTDAPPGTRFMGISNGNPPDEGDRTTGRG